MKHLSFSALLLFVILITGSCKKIPVVNYTNSSISFKVDGVLKEAKGDKSVFSFYAKEENIMMIAGNLDAAGDQHILLAINNFHGVGVYSGEENFLGSYTTPEFEESIIGSDGAIKITEYTEGKSIKGEFQYKGERAIISTDPNHVPEFKVFSEGKFSAKITAGAFPQP